MLPNTLGKKNPPGWMLPNVLGWEHPPDLRPALRFGWRKYSSLDNPLLNGYTVAYLAKTMFGVDREYFIFFVFCAKTFFAGVTSF
jgi:hypothetical protein